ncbi:MAG TPA: flagellar motor switch protein FliN [Chthonomonadaceae bacterium]|nr:flagellar motor switch protein FliN [Chthonomonadaceae bacterium]
MPELSPKEIYALNDLLANLRPHLSQALAEVIHHEGALEMPDVCAVSTAEIRDRNESVLYTIFSLNRPLPIECLLVFSERAACVFANLIEGRNDSAPLYRLMQEQVEKLSAAMTRIAQSFATALASLTGDAIGLESSETHLSPITLPPVFAQSDSAVQARLMLNLPDTLDTEITFLFTPEYAQALAAAIAPAGDWEEERIERIPLPDTDVTPVLTGSLIEPGAGPRSGRGGGRLAEEGGHRGGTTPFADWARETLDTTLPRGLELILDIPLEVTVELGRVRMLIKDVLALASGSIVELDKVAGEPVDLLVNGRLVAKGEVVVIEDNFGIRITEIVSPEDRVAGLKG